MNQENSTTVNQYQVVGKEYLEQDAKSNIWASFDNWLEASNHAQWLTKQFDNLSFFVRDIKPHTDEEIMLEFSHLDFGTA